VRNIYDVIKRPLVTEKGMALINELNVYPFEVDKRATKQEIARAVMLLAEETFGKKVHVVSVRTQSRKGKPRRRRMRAGRTKNWKKALVRLAEGDKLEFL
jgi:large subunit ribosomal protein L23